MNLNADPAASLKFDYRIVKLDQLSDWNFIPDGCTAVDLVDKKLRR